MQEEGDMSRKEFSVAYNGAGRGGDHSIDVDLLAPALLAFGKLIREANKEFNGKATKANVLVVSDFEHKCFNINFEVAVTMLEQLRALVGMEQVKDAKDILEWVGLIAGGSISTLTFLGILKWRKGRKLASVTEITDSDQSGMISLQIEGDSNSVTVNHNTWNLANNPRALAAARDALSPIGTDGFDRIELRDGDKIIGEIPKEDAENILASCFTGIEEAKDVTPDVDVSPAWLTVFGPVYDAAAPKWRFKLGKEEIYVDISETTIAEDALARGGALAEDAYQVRLEIETPKTPEGKPKKPSYKIIEVMRFIPATPMLQANLILPDATDPEQSGGNT